VVNTHNLGPSRTMAPLKPEYLETLPIPETDDLPYEYHRNLMAAVRGDEPPHVTWSQMLRVMRIVDLARESAQANTVLSVRF